MNQILLVDDEKYISKGLKSGVDWESLNVDTIYTAQNAEAALGIIRERRPDVVVTDIRMPGMSGLELIKTAKEEYPEIPFVILSGYPDFASGGLRSSLWRAAPCPLLLGEGGPGAARDGSGAAHSTKSVPPHIRLGIAAPPSP